MGVMLGEESSDGGVKIDSVAPRAAPRKDAGLEAGGRDPKTGTG